MKATLTNLINQYNYFIQGTPYEQLWLNHGHYISELPYGNSYNLNLVKDVYHLIDHLNDNFPNYYWLNKKLLSMVEIKLNNY